MLAASGAAGGVVWFQHAEEAHQEAEAAERDRIRHQAHPVTFTIQADGYTADDGPIPLHITGTDLAGNAVDTTAHIAADGTGTELSAGSHTASVAASPLMQDGSLYAVPDASHALRIPESDDETPEEVTPDQPIALTKLDASAETDKLIDAAYQAAIASGMDSGKASVHIRGSQAEEDGFRSSAAGRSPEGCHRKGGGRCP